MKAHIGLNEYDKALKISNDVDVKNLEQNLKTIYSISSGDIYSEKGFYDKAFEYYLYAKKSNIDKRSIKRINKRIYNVIPMNLNRKNLDLLFVLEDNEKNKNLILLAMAFNDISGEKFEASTIFSLIDYSQLDRDFRGYYNFIKKNTDLGISFGKKVGVVLPLSGENSEIPKAFLDGLLESNRISNSRNKIQFIVVDNYGSQVNTITAFNTLVENHNVSAIIGPFSDENLISGANSISNINIPIFSPFSTNSSLSMINENIYFLNSSINFKNELLVKHILDDLNLKNIAIIAPRSKDGILEVDSFLTSLDKQNKEPVFIGWYELNQDIDLRENFKELRKVAWEIESQNEYQEFLGVDIDVLDSMFDVESDEVYDMFNIQEDDSIDSTKVILETIDGIFFPVERPTLNFIASQISLSNLQTQLMGNDGWLDMDLLKEEAIYPHISDMIFVTSYSPKYNVGNSYDFNPVLNNAFHFGLDFSNFLINTKTINGVFDLEQSSNFKGYTREFDFSNSKSNISPKIVKFSNKKIYNTYKE
tara:strand:+ start:2 stop:1603 length:1602 start_codon:yes stop_codon:yes gene_type:complete